MALKQNQVKYGLRVQSPNGNRGIVYGTIINDEICRAYRTDWNSFSGAHNPKAKVYPGYLYPGYQQCKFVRVWWDIHNIPTEHFLRRMEPIQSKTKGPHRLKILLHGVKETFK